MNAELTSLMAISGAFGCDVVVSTEWPVATTTDDGILNDADPSPLEYEAPSGYAIKSIVVREAGVISEAFTIDKNGTEAEVTNRYWVGEDLLIGDLITTDDRFPISRFTPTTGSYMVYFTKL